MPGEVESVSLLRYARDDEVAAVEAAFARAGYTIEARPVVELRGIENMGAASLPWHVYVALGVPIGMFLQGFLGAAGEDAYHAVKRWAVAIFDAHDTPWRTVGSLDVRDPEGTRLVLTPPLPDEAFDALRDIDWQAVQGGDLHWDAVRGVWHNPAGLD